MKYLAVLFFIPVVVWAGGSRAGNGGDVVYCPQSSNRPLLQQLDFYELSFYDGQEAILGSPADAPLVKVSYVINWIRQFSPIRADLYNERLQNFMSRVSWSQVPLVDIPDSQHIVLPANCEIRQLAIQDQVTYPVHYTIDKTLWDQMDNTNKAGLILHEIVYEEALRNKHENSIDARSLVRFFVRKKLATDTALWSFIKNLYDRNFKNSLELPFKNGDSGIFASTEITQFNDDYFYDNNEYFCGYRIVGQSDVNFCDQPVGKRNRFWIQGVEDRSRILKIFVAVRPEEDPIYFIPPQEVNIPFSVLDYEIPRRIKPAQDVDFENEFLKVSCAKSEWMYLSGHFAGENYFDLGIQYPTDCKLASVSSVPQISIENSWRPVKWPVNYDKYVPRFEFSNPETIHLFAQSLKISEAEFNDKKQTVYPAEKQALKIQSSNCILKSDSYIEIDQPNHAVSLENIDCKIPIKKVDIFWSSATLSERDGSVSEGSLSSKAQKLAVVIRQCSFGDKPNNSLPIVDQGTFQIPAGQFVKSTYQTGFVVETCDWRY